MEEIKQETKLCINTNITVDDYKRAIGAQSNNYASSYAIPIGTPKAERKGHNGPHESHIHNFMEKK